MYSKTYTEGSDPFELSCLNLQSRRKFIGHAVEIGLDEFLRQALINFLVNLVIS